MNLTLEQILLFAAVAIVLRASYQFTQAERRLDASLARIEKLETQLAFISELRTNQIIQGDRLDVLEAAVASLKNSFKEVDGVVVRVDFFEKHQEQLREKVHSLASAVTKVKMRQHLFETGSTAGALEDSGKWTAIKTPTPMSLRLPGNDDDEPTSSG